MDEEFKENFKPRKHREHFGEYVRRGNRAMSLMIAIEILGLFLIVLAVLFRFIFGQENSTLSLIILIAGIFCAVPPTFYIIKDQMKKNKEKREEDAINQNQNSNEMFYHDIEQQFTPPPTPYVNQQLDNPEMNPDSPPPVSENP